MLDLVRPLKDRAEAERQRQQDVGDEHQPDDLALAPLADCTGPVQSRHITTRHHDLLVTSLQVGLKDDDQAPSSFSRRSNEHIVKPFEEMQLDQNSVEKTDETSQCNDHRVWKIQLSNHVVHESTGLHEERGSKLLL